MMGEATTSASLDPPRPVGWPGNIPYMRGLDHATFAGLRQFYSTMTTAERGVFRPYILGINDEHTLSDGEFGVMVDLRRLFEVYCMVSDSSKEVFRSSVVCLSHPGGPIPDAPDERVPPRNLRGDAVPVEGPQPDHQDSPPAHIPTWSLPHTDPIPPIGRQPQAPPKGLRETSFDRSVGGVLLPHDDPGTPGYCYLSLVVPSARERVGAALCRNPWGPAVAAALLAEPGIWAGGKFTLTLGMKHTTDEGPNFTQAHVAEAHHGMRVQEVLARLSGTVRVGMATSDLNAMVNLQRVDAAPSQKRAFNIEPEGKSMELSIGVFALVGSDPKKYPPFQWNVLSTPVLMAMLAIYESVRLEAAHFDVKIEQGAANEVFCAITSSGVTLSSRASWASAPVNTIINGSDQGAVSAVFELPAMHTFSPELRANSMGNSPPQFHFAFLGNPNAIATIQGRIKVRVTGQAILNFVNIGGTGGFDAQIRTMAKDCRRMRKHLGISDVSKSTITEEDSDSEESDEEEEAAPAPRSPPKAPAANQSKPVVRGN